MPKKLPPLPKQKAQILNSETIYEGKAFGVRRDELVEPSGVRTIREMVTHPGSVVVLPVLPDGRIVLIRQYRYAARQFLWELVAGRMEAGEDPIEAATRELQEETGYRAKKLRVFMEFYPTPGFLEEKMFLLLAEGLTAGEAKPEEDEKIVTEIFTKREAMQLLKQKKLHDGKTIAGLLYYFEFLARR